MPTRTARAPPPVHCGPEGAKIGRGRRTGRCGVSRGLVFVRGGAVCRCGVLWGVAWRAAFPQDPPARTVLGGFSQGAVMTLDVGLRAPEHYAALVAMSGYLAEADDFPGYLAGRRDQPLLLIHGTRDQVLPVSLARRARQYLETNGLAPEYQEFAMAHEVSGESLQLVGDFLKRHLNPGDNAA